MIKTLEVGIEMTDYQKFKAIYDEIDVLIAHNVKSSTPEFVTWRTKATRFLNNYYGEKSEESTKFKTTNFHPTIMIVGAFNEGDYISYCRSALNSTKAIFIVYLDEIKEKEVSNIQEGQPKQSVHSLNKVFIVHGHDNALKQEVARIIEKQGIEAVILSEQVNQGKTIIEKIEENADVGAAICLFTGDDCGKVKDANSENLRARQNVVFEAGYFMGKLGRKNIILIASPDIEIPSDLQGVVYTNEKSWQIDVLKELKAIGYAIDFNKAF